MTATERQWTLLLLGVGAVLIAAVHAANDFHTARVDVFFSPSGGCAAAIVRELNAAKKSVKVQAYSFTSVAIAKAVADARCCTCRRDLGHF